jgi:hypothetical protein
LRRRRQAGTSDVDLFADEHDRTVTAIAAQLPDMNVARFYELASVDTLTDAQAEELAELVLPLMASSDEGGGDPVGAADLVGAWKLAAAETSAAGGASFEVPDDESFGVAAPVAGARRRRVVAGIPRPPQRTGSPRSGR